MSEEGGGGERRGNGREEEREERGESVCGRVSRSHWLVLYWQ